MEVCTVEQKGLWDKYVFENPAFCEWSLSKYRKMSARWFLVHPKVLQNHRTLRTVSQEAPTLDFSQCAIWSTCLACFNFFLQLGHGDLKTIDLSSSHEKDIFQNGIRKERELVTFDWKYIEHWFDSGLYLELHVVHSLQWKKGTIETCTIPSRSSHTTFELIVGDPLDWSLKSSRLHVASKQNYSVAFPELVRRAV